MPLMPAFHRNQKDVATVGRLIAGHGELELMLSAALGVAIASKRKRLAKHNRSQHRVRFKNMAIKSLFSVRGEMKRFDFAKRRMHEAYEKAGLESEYVRTMGAFKKCLDLRNLFAHCHWGQHVSTTLQFCSLEETAKIKGRLRIKFRFATAESLAKIEEYFWITFQWLEYLAKELSSEPG